MRRWIAAGMLSTARYLIRTARRIHPPVVTWVDGAGKRWTYPNPRKGVLTLRSAIYTGGPSGPAMRRYIEDHESRGWN
ncbi:hypothetical protein [Nocardia gipuzkoensis]